MSKIVNNPVVLITGASRGIGRSVALEYARKGARLILVARDKNALENVAQLVEAAGGEPVVIPTDVSDIKAVESLIKKVLAKYERIDILVNNAGIGRVGSIREAGFEKDVRATLEASLFGMIRMTQLVLPTMMSRNSGAIVNMSSVMGRKAFAKFGSYAIVMHGVSAFTDALRQELAGTEIHVAAIHPALTATGLLCETAESNMPPSFRYMTPLSPDKVALAIVRAVDRRQRRVVLPWQPNIMLLGEALSPWLGDLIARALTIRFIAKLLGLNNGPSYHKSIIRDQIVGTSTVTDS